LINLSSSNLAINGGPPIRTEPWQQNITTGDEEIEAATRVLKIGRLSYFEGSMTPSDGFSFWGGPEVIALEDEWKSYYGAKHAVSVNSATSGLYAAIGALGIGFGDEVITSPYTMSACATAPLIYGAIPVFADVEESTGCLDPKSIEAAITPRTKAILVVHQFGFPADMTAIMGLANKHDLRVIEDCAQAHGATFEGRSVGTFGDIGVFSLNVNKSIQIGEGGVCITDDDDVRMNLALIRNHAEAVVEMADVEDITNMLGFNYRLTEFAAAIAREQLKKLDRLNIQRLELVESLSEKISSYEFLKLVTPPAGSTRNGTYYVFPYRFDPKIAGIKREDFVAAANAEGLSIDQGYVRPLYLQPLFQKRTAFKNGYPWSAPENSETSASYELGECPVAEKLHFDEMLVDEHIRPPHTQADVDDIGIVFDKIAGRLHT
jgi:perosamine synthetase